IAIRLVISTPRMIQRRRYTVGSVSASAATLELSACGETPGVSMVPSPGPSEPAMARTSRGGRVHRPGKANNTEHVRIAKHSRLSPARPAGHAEGVRGRHHGATRQEDSHDRTAQ